jgi:HlyD family secretion protein
LKAGQTAKAEIVVRRRTIAEMLLDPIRQLQKGGITL